MSSGITFKLNNGVGMPGLGFGTFANEGSVGETYRAALKALQVGYRLLDCAWFYKNEGEVGAAVRDFLKANPSVKRQDIFLTTKVWNHMHRYEDVLWSFNSSLERLQVEYIDLFLIHWPIAAEKEDNEEPKIGSDGKVKSSCSSFESFFLCFIAIAADLFLCHLKPVRYPERPDREP